MENNFKIGDRIRYKPYSLIRKESIHFYLDEKELTSKKIFIIRKIENYILIVQIEGTNEIDFLDNSYVCKVEDYDNLLRLNCETIKIISLKD